MGAREATVDIHTVLPDASGLIPTKQAQDDGASDQSYADTIHFHSADPHHHK